MSAANPSRERLLAVSLSVVPVVLAESVVLPSLPPVPSVPWSDRLSSRSSAAAERTEFSRRTGSATPSPDTAD
ncbi:hypothetical protein STAL104432_04960 [Streptomyces albus]